MIFWLMLGIVTLIGFAAANGKISPKSRAFLFNFIIWVAALLCSAVITRVVALRSFNWVTNSFVGAPAIGLPALAIALLISVIVFISLTLLFVGMINWLRK